ncbi:hypothetical protein Pme01_54180 [Planosporangium mesophilum]|uniref:Uncharacterized protein n=1 Tax=Planosporangium mesophilum TaxID=689768 RepID=A0A8J3X3C1_9ACTN|nr:hypothetical protein Pme01_54180 [Planosporangium mesophilum]
MPTITTRGPSVPHSNGSRNGAGPYSSRSAGTKLIVAVSLHRFATSAGTDMRSHASPTSLAGEEVILIDDR